MEPSYRNKYTLEKEQKYAWNRSQSTSDDTDDELLVIKAKKHKHSKHSLKSLIIKRKSEQSPKELYTAKKLRALRANSSDSSTSLPKCTKAKKRAKDYKNYDSDHKYHHKHHKCKKRSPNRYSSPPLEKYPKLYMDEYEPPKSKYPPQEKAYPFVDKRAKYDYKTFKSPIDKTDNRPPYNKPKISKYYESTQPYSSNNEYSSQYYKADYSSYIPKKTSSYQKTSKQFKMQDYFQPYIPNDNSFGNDNRETFDENIPKRNSSWEPDTEVFGSKHPSGGSMASYFDEGHQKRHMPSVLSRATKVSPWKAVTEDMLAGENSSYQSKVKIQESRDHSNLTDKKESSWFGKRLSPWRPIVEQSLEEKFAQETKKETRISKLTCPWEPFGEEMRGKKALPLEQDLRRKIQAVLKPNENTQVSEADQDDQRSGRKSETDAIFENFLEWNNEEELKLLKEVKKKMVEKDEPTQAEAGEVPKAKEKGGIYEEHSYSLDENLSPSKPPSEAPEKVAPQTGTGKKIISLKAPFIKQEETRKSMEEDFSKVASSKQRKQAELKSLFKELEKLKKIQISMMKMKLQKPEGWQMDTLIQENTLLQEELRQQIEKVEAECKKLENLARSVAQGKTLDPDTRRQMATVEEQPLQPSEKSDRDCCHLFDDILPTSLLCLEHLHTKAHLQEILGQSEGLQLPLASGHPPPPHFGVHFIQLFLELHNMYSVTTMDNSSVGPSFTATSTQAEPLSSSTPCTVPAPTTGGKEKFDLSSSLDTSQDGYLTLARMVQTPEPGLSPATRKESSQDGLKFAPSQPARGLKRKKIHDCDPDLVYYGDFETSGEVSAPLAENLETDSKKLKSKPDSPQQLALQEDKLFDCSTPMSSLSEEAVESLLQIDPQPETKGSLEPSLNTSWMGHSPPASSGNHQLYSDPESSPLGCFNMAGNSVGPDYTSKGEGSDKDEVVFVAESPLLPSSPVEICSFEDTELASIDNSAPKQKASSSQSSVDLSGTKRSRQSPTDEDGLLDCGDTEERSMGEQGELDSLLVHCLHQVSKACSPSFRDISTNEEIHSPSFTQEQEESGPEAKTGLDFLLDRVSKDKETCSSLSGDISDKEEMLLLGQEENRAKKEREEDQDSLLDQCEVSKAREASSPFSEDISDEEELLPLGQEENGAKEEREEQDSLLDQCEVSKEREASSPFSEVIFDEEELLHLGQEENEAKEEREEEQSFLDQCEMSKEREASSPSSGDISDKEEMLPLGQEENGEKKEREEKQDSLLDQCEVSKEREASSPSSGDISDKEELLPRGQEENGERKERKDSLLDQCEVSKEREASSPSSGDISDEELLPCGQEENGENKEREEKDSLLDQCEVSKEREASSPESIFTDDDDLPLVLLQDRNISEVQKMKGLSHHLTQIGKACSPRKIPTDETPAVQEDGICKTRRESLLDQVDREKQPSPLGDIAPDPSPMQEEDFNEELHSLLGQENKKKVAFSLSPGDISPDPSPMQEEDFNEELHSLLGQENKGKEAFSLFPGDVSKKEELPSPGPGCEVMIEEEVDDSLIVRSLDQVSQENLPSSPGSTDFLSDPELRSTDPIYSSHLQPGPVSVSTQKKRRRSLNRASDTGGVKRRLSRHEAFLNQSKTSVGYLSQDEASQKPCPIPLPYSSLA